MNNQKTEAMFAKVDEWKYSGKTLRAFAASHGISRSCFSYWIRKRQEALNSSPKFVELLPSANPIVGKVSPSEKPQAAPGVQIVFTFPSGLCVKVYG